MSQRTIAIALMAIGLGAGIASAQLVVRTDPGTPSHLVTDTPTDGGFAHDRGKAA